MRDNVIHYVGDDVDDETGDMEPLCNESIRGDLVSHWRAEVSCEDCLALLRPPV